MEQHGKLLANDVRLANTYRVCMFLVIVAIISGEVGCVSKVVAKPQYKYLPVIEIKVEPVYDDCNPPRGELVEPEQRAKGHSLDSPVSACI
jgi:hypothetical protein